MPTIPTDPLFAQQWYLHNTNAGQFDLNIIGAWDDYTGNGVQVTVMDDGFDFAHDDIDGNYLTGLDYDNLQNDFNPSPAFTDDNHGTSVIGILGAEQGNGYGGVGVAWNVDLVGYRGFGIGASWSDDAFLDAAGLGDGIGNTNGDGNGSDIISMSAGTGSSVFLTNANYDDAIAALATISANGRDGLGTIFVKSSGNSRAAPGSTAREEGTTERYDSTEFSINVAALRQDGWVTDFSTPGANVLVSAFADNTSNLSSIVTTDRTGSPGYNTTDFTTTFGGTSAAAPQVAGIVALMLEANPDLGWRDVQIILAHTARHVGSQVDAAANAGAPAGGGHEQATQAGGSTWFWNDGNSWNGGGLHFSNDYGYGLVDALAAVRLAETWRLQSTSANQAATFEDDVNTTVTFDSATQTYTINEPTDIRVEHVSIELDFATTFLADIELFLTSPGGTRVQLLADTGDSANYDGRWRFGTTAFMGEQSAGDWTLEVVDDSAGDPLTIRDADLRTSGSAVTSDDLFVFTNEYSDYAGIGGHTTTINGGTGTNTLNAAAVSTASTIDLDANSGTIDGVAVTIVAIQIVYAGDGDDTLIGDALSLELHGGRGNDTVAGGSGNEMLFGDAGNDSVFGGLGNDTIAGGAGNDVLWGQGGDDAMSGGTGDDSYLVEQAGDTVAEAPGAGTDTVFAFVDTTLSANVEIGALFGAASVLNGNGGANVLIGNAGSDTLSGLGGDDTLYGVEGTNTLLGGAGNDYLVSGTGVDSMAGGANDDTYIIGAGDVVTEAAGEGTDTVYSSLAAYTLTANVEIGVLLGGATLVGNALNNTLIGDGGSNMLFGLAGNDFLVAGAGGDTLVGGDGLDTMQGNSGTDIFRWDALAELGDIIQDWVSADDVLAFTAAAFGFTVGHVLTASLDFIAGAAPVAAVSGATFLWDTDDTNLLFDADGTGAGGALLVADLQAFATLDVSDFLFA